MMESWGKKKRRTGIFLALNMAAALLMLALIVAPLASHFSSRSDYIRESAEQLAHFQRIISGAQALDQSSSRSVQPFLIGSEERVLSADLQASLQAAASAKGVRVLGLRGLQSGRLAQLRTVTVSMELEGDIGALRDLAASIEDQSPFLFITEADLRSVADGDGSIIRAEFRIEGAVQASSGNPPSMKDDQRSAEAVDGGAQQ